MKNAAIFIVLAALLFAGAFYYNKNYTPIPAPMNGDNIQVTALAHADLAAAITAAPAIEYTQDNGLVVKDITQGSGPAAKEGDRVTVNYIGRLADGTQFDTSLQQGRTPFSFSIGAGGVIQGWEEGVAGMQKGGVRVLVIPAALGYGPGGYPPIIPANATLTFAIQLLDIQ